MPLQSLGLEAEVAVVAADLLDPEVEVAVDAKAKRADPTEALNPLLDPRLIALPVPCCADPHPLSTA